MTRAPSFSFDELLSLIAERTAALRDAAASATDLGGRVPSCPDWTLRDLVTHVTEVQNFWSVAVATGPSEDAPAVAAPPPGLATATEALLAALRAAGPEAACWTWWGSSGTPMTAGAVARHQVHEAAVHAYDAQLAVGRPQSVPAPIALDGIAEFIGVSLGSSGEWPHDPARVAVHTTEGPSFELDLSSTGARLLDGPTTARERIRGSASDVLLTLYGRLPLDRLRTEGDRTVLRQLLAWPPLG